MPKSRTALYIIGIAIAMLAASLLTALVFYLTGVLSADRVELEFTVKAVAPKEYDGTPLRATEYELNKGSLNEGDSLDVKILGEQTDFGTSESDLLVRIVNKDGRDVTGDYSIKVNKSLLTVKKREITICINKQPITYSGKEVVVENYTVYKGVEPPAEGEEWEEGKLYAGHKLALSFPGFKNVGDRLPETYSNENVCIYDLQGNNVARNYEFTLIVKDEGPSIVPRKLKIRAVDAEKYYDGTPIQPKYELINGGNLVSGQFISDVEFSEQNGKSLELINAGESRRVKVSKFTVYEQVGFDFVPVDEKNYIIDEDGDSEAEDSAYATISVKPCPVTVTAKNIEKIYDGDSLESRLSEPEELYTVSVGGALAASFEASGYSLQIDVGNLQRFKNLVDACSESYAIEGIQIMKNDADYSDQFDITSVGASVRIDPIRLGVTALADKEYNYTGREIVTLDDLNGTNFVDRIDDFLSENSLPYSAISKLNLLKNSPQSYLRITCNRTICNADDYRYNLELNDDGLALFGSAGNIVLNFTSAKLKVNKLAVTLSYCDEAGTAITEVSKVYDGEEYNFDLRKFKLSNEEGNEIDNISISSFDAVYLNADGEEDLSGNHALVLGKWQTIGSILTFIYDSYTVQPQNFRLVNALNQNVTENFNITLPSTVGVTIQKRKISAIAGTPNIVKVVDEIPTDDAIFEFMQNEAENCRSSISFENLANGDAVTRISTGLGATFQEFSVDASQIYDSDGNAKADEFSISASLPSNETGTLPCIYNKNMENVTECYELVNDGEAIITVQLMVKTSASA